MNSTAKNDATNMAEWETAFIGTVFSSLLNTFRRMPEASPVWNLRNESNGPADARPSGRRPLPTL